MIGKHMEVDPAILSGFAEFVQDASGILEGEDAIEPFSSARDCLPGTELQQLCDEASGFLSAGLLGMSQRLNTIAEAARGAADDYRVAEADFTAQLRAMRVSE